MSLEGGCYCGKLRYRTDGKAMMRAECHCRECQYLSGGGPNFFMVVSASGFSYSQGTPKTFTRSDLAEPVTREFCADCGTHITSRKPGLPAAILKIGTLDDPKAFGGPQMAIYVKDRQPFHCIAEGLPQFEGLPPRG